jgi:hypothetical protein
MSLPTNLYEPAGDTVRTRRQEPRVLVASRTIVSTAAAHKMPFGIENATIAIRNPLVRIRNAVPSGTGSATDVTVEHIDAELSSGVRLGGRRIEIDRDRTVSDASRPLVPHVIR